MKEVHEDKFTGWWIPRELVDLFNWGDLGKSELILTAMIQGLAGKSGCYASNEYLAKRLRVTESRVKQMLRRLLKMGLLQSKSDEKNQRILSTFFNNLEPAGGWNKFHPGVEKIPPLSPPKGETDNKEENKSPRALSGLGGCGFFSDPSQPQTRHQKWAKKLYEALAKRRRITTTAKPERWAKEFEKIERTWMKVDGPTEDTTQRIQLALRWYIEHMDEPYMPHADSPTTFSEKLIAIERRMKKDETGNHISDMKPDDLDGPAKEIYEEIKPTLVWPKGCISQLPRVLAASVLNYEAALQRRSSVIKALKAKVAKGEVDKEGWPLYADEQAMLRFIKFIRERNIFGGDVQAVLPIHFHFVSERVADWKDWSGNLAPEIWSLDNKQWNARGREASTEYASDTELWDTLHKLLLETTT